MQAPRPKYIEGTLDKMPKIPTNTWPAQKDTASSGVRPGLTPLAYPISSASSSSSSSFSSYNTQSTTTTSTSTSSISSSGMLANNAAAVPVTSSSSSSSFGFGSFLLGMVVGAVALGGGMLCVLSYKNNGHEFLSRKEYIDLP